MRVPRSKSRLVVGTVLLVVMASAVALAQTTIYWNYVQ